MPPYLYARRVVDNEYVQKVRSFDPASLLLHVAAASASNLTQEQWLKSPHMKFTPWALADIARVSIVHGNKFRAPATMQDLLVCCAAHSSLVDPEFSRGKPSIDDFMRFMLRLSNEQLIHAENPLNSFARSIALFKQTAVEQDLRILHSGWSQELLGTPSIVDYVSAGFLIFVGVTKNAGMFSFDWLDQSNFVEVCEELPAATVREAAATQFVASMEEIKELDSKSQRAEYRRFSFNPLQSRPIVTGAGEVPIVPSVHLLIKKVSTSGLYYAGVKRWGEKFTQDTGKLFEKYVGNNLALISDANVFAEITYRESRQERKSVDWFVVLRDVVLLVEVKSTRPSESVRVASSDAGASIEQSLWKAVAQLDQSASRIREGHPAFREIPADRPLVGLVVTMESFHVLNARVYSQFLPDCSIPYKIASAHDLENLVTIEGEALGSALIEGFGLAEFVDSGILHMVEKLPRGRNAVLDAAWAELPWKER